MKGARIRVMTQSTSTTSASGFPPFPPPFREPPIRPPKRKWRPNPSPISATAPMIAANSVISRTSRFRMWENSCATTPCSSSRFNAWSRPSVTAMWACAVSIPVAKALGSLSGTIQILGFGSIAEIAISSTTLTSCCSSSPRGSTTSRAPAAQSTRSAPLVHACHTIAPATATTIIPTQGITWWYCVGGRSRVAR